MDCRPKSGITCALHYYDDKPPEKITELAEDWHQVITEWYPELDTKVYCPSHFRAVHYSKHPDDLKVPVQDFKNLRAFKRETVKHSEVKNDEAQQRMLWTFATFCLRKNTNKGKVAFTQDCKNTNKDKVVFTQDTGVHTETCGNFQFLSLQTPNSSEHGKMLSTKYQPAFILSNMNFQHYLCKYKPAGKPIVKKPEVGFKGEIDIIVIDKKFGIFILEIKATGDNPADLIAVIQRPKKPSLVDQVRNQVQYMKSIIGCLNLDQQQPISIRAAVLLPNIQRKTLDDVLREKPYFQDQVKSFQDLVFLCKEDLPSQEEDWSGRLTDQKYNAILKMWTGAKTSTSQQPMSITSYRFAGPLTSVRVYYNNTMPRLGKECVLEGAAAHMIAARFTVLALHSNQIEILVKEKDVRDNKAAQFVHLEGPPGTGKTLTLLIRILTWLDEGHVVWLLSLSPQSRSITHTLREQVKHMLIDYKFSQECFTEEKKKEYIHRLRMFMMIKPAETCSRAYFEIRLGRFEKRARKLREEFKLVDSQGKVCVVLDETLIDSSSEDCVANNMFFDAVSKLYLENEEKQSQQGSGFTEAGPTESGTAEPAITPFFERGLSVWSAALHKDGRPSYVAKYGHQSTEKFGLLWKLKFPMRCPPSVQRALMCVQDSLTEKVCRFDKAMAVAHPVKQDGPLGPHNQYVAQGMPVKLIAHGSHSNKVNSVWECSQCGTKLAEYLKNTLHIGETETAERMKSKTATQDKFLPFASVIIVSTRQAYKGQTLNSGFHTAMTDKRLEIALSASREEGDAPLPDSVQKDVIMVSDITSIHGMERAVVIIIPEVKIDYSESQESADGGTSGAATGRNETPMNEDVCGGDTRAKHSHGPPCEEDKIKTAFASLHADCRRDIFFIGSRAVSQLIVFYSGKEPAEIGSPVHDESQVSQATGGESMSLQADPQVTQGPGEELMETS